MKVLFNLQQLATFLFVALSTITASCNAFVSGFLSPAIKRKGASARFATDGENENISMARARRSLATILQRQRLEESFSVLSSVEECDVRDISSCGSACAKCNGEGATRCRFCSGSRMFGGARCLVCSGRGLEVCKG